jgi:hypothetical protein
VQDRSESAEAVVLKFNRTREWLFSFSLVFVRRCADDRCDDCSAAGGARTAGGSGERDRTRGRISLYDDATGSRKVMRIPTRQSGNRCKVIAGSFAQSHIHPMANASSPARRTAQSEFGMHSRERRSWVPCEGTHTLSAPWHSRQTRGTSSTTRGMVRFGFGTRGRVRLWWGRCKRSKAGSIPLHSRLTVDVSSRVDMAICSRLGMLKSISHRGAHSRPFLSRARDDSIASNNTLVH